VGRNVQRHASRDLHEPGTVGPRQVGDGLDRPFAPEQAVGEGRAVAHVDAGADAPAALQRCAEGSWLEGADGSSFAPSIASSGTVNVIDPAVIPVPATAWLFGSALLGIGVLRRRS